MKIDYSDEQVLKQTPALALAIILLARFLFSFVPATHSKPQRYLGV